jgi:hypothetical protein
MRTNPTREKNLDARRGERGAALVTTLLLSTLLLLAGGALLVKTSGSVGVAYDATSEMQAYYAAEAGLQASLNVLRGNHENEAGDKATFDKAVADGGTLGAWLGYNDDGRVSVGDHAYSVVVTDASEPPVAAGETPSRLHVTATGYGPRGARKELEMLIRNLVDLEIPGAVTLRGNSDGTGGMALDLGNSSGREFLTDDADPKPVFVVTNGADSAEVVETMENDEKNNGENKATYDDPPLGDTSAGTAELPDFLTNTELTYSVVDQLREAAEDNKTIHFYDGDHSHTGEGSGTLVVTGTLTIHGSFSWDGLILVLGDGVVEWKGGGNVEEGNINGAMFIANYDPDDLGAGYGNPSFTISGGGKGTLSYNRDSAEAALAALGFRVAGVKEQ